MWIRKSDLEIKNFLTQKEKENKSLRRPLIWATAFGLLFMIFHYFGFRGGSARAGIYLVSSHTGFSPQTLFFGVFGFIFFFALIYYHQRKGSSLFNHIDGLLCSECKEPAAVSPEKICECGGKLEPFEFYTWEG